MTLNRPMGTDDSEAYPSKREILRQAVRELGAPGCVSLVGSVVFLGLLVAIILVPILWGNDTPLCGLLGLWFASGVICLILAARTVGRLAAQRYQEIDQDAKGHQWDVEAILGPLSTDWGFRNWDLYLTKEVVFAVPTGIGATLALGLPGDIENAGYGNTYPAPEVAVIVDSGNPRWRRYPVDQLESIVMEKRWYGPRHLRLARRGAFEVDTYSIPPQIPIKRYREELGYLYGPMYREKRFRD